jgi:hypothetical protein
MLKKWESRVETINVATLDDELVEGEEKIWESIDCSKASKTFNIGQHLSPIQTSELQKLLAEFPDVFSDEIECTDLVDHVIKVTNQHRASSHLTKCQKHWEMKLNEKLSVN